MQLSPTLQIDALISEAMKEDTYWIPGLAQLLTKRLWHCHSHKFCPSTYGSLRWLHSDPKSSRIVMANINIGDKSPIMIEALPLNTRQYYKKLDLQLLADCPSTKDVELFQKALSLLNFSAGLLDAVVTLVRSVHLLTADKLNYDTSYSDPELPCSIFVSVPTGGKNARLRLAESIVHEAMHLQLTMLEKELPLVHDTTATSYSPWQRTNRPINGLIHGLFVFCVINQWLWRLMDSRIFGDEEHVYISKRRIDIANEIKMVSKLSNTPFLTEFGRRFVVWLLEARLLRNANVINEI